MLACENAVESYFASVVEYLLDPQPMTRVQFMELLAAASAQAVAFASRYVDNALSNTLATTYS